MKRLIVGEFPLRTEHGIEGMSRVGYIDDLEVYINSDDPGNIPHVHIRDGQNWSNFHTCVQLESPEYFLHGNKQDVLNAKQRRELQEFMESRPAKQRRGITAESNWDLCCYLWDLNNSDVSISDDAEMPDYRQLH